MLSREAVCVERHCEVGELRFGISDHSEHARSVRRLGGEFKVWHVALRIGYHEKLNVPALLTLCRAQGLLEKSLDLEHAQYFLSRITLTPSDATLVRLWRKRLFIAMARNAASPIEAFRLPTERTVMIGAQIAV